MQSGRFGCIRASSERPVDSLAVTDGILCGAAVAIAANRAITPLFRLAATSFALASAFGVLRFDQTHTGDAQFAAEVEQIVLNTGQTFMDIRRQVGYRQYHSDGAVRLVDRTVSLDAGMVLGDARAVTEARRAVIAGLRVDLTQAVSHAV